MNNYEEIKTENVLESIVGIDKLKTQNERIRNDIKVLSRVLDETLDRQKKPDRKKVRVPLRDEPIESDKDPQVPFAKVYKYKKEISSIKKQVDGNVNEIKSVELESQSRFLAKRVQELDTEGPGSYKTEKEQKKVLDIAGNSQGYPEKLESLRQEIKGLREKYRDLQTQEKSDEKTLKTQHEKCVDLEEKCRKLKGVIRQKKSEGIELKPPEVTESDILELENKLKETEQKKKEEERKLKKRIKELETQIGESKHNINMLNVKLKEKDQECRLSVLKIKELKRGVRHNQLRPLPRVPHKADDPEKRVHDAEFSSKYQDCAEGKLNTKNRSDSSSSKSSKKSSDSD